MDNLKTVNIVAVGLLEQEFDLNYLATSLTGNTRYEPEMHPGLYLYTDDGLAILYRTGKFIVTGSKSREGVNCSKENMISILSEITQCSVNLQEFEICNYVLSGDLGMELELSSISVGLGLERTEYDPDSLAAVLYTPDQADCTIMIFRSGKVNIVGESSKARSKQAFRELHNKIRSLMDEK
ncbi:TATA-box-binding protein [Natronobacterium haloterrestre]|uniref:hypothetical protein n=1 Tax=Natronobacterium haloterrestre TaxID=148448 RepID=UPI000B7CF2A4|nr:hypothetical protein [Halobiforma haloterrestris]